MNLQITLSAFPFLNLSRLLILKPLMTSDDAFSISLISMSLPQSVFILEINMASQIFSSFPPAGAASSPPSFPAADGSEPT
jgi:hypothetical protein